MASRKRKASSSKSGKRPRLVSRDLPELQRARAHWQENRFPQALKLFEEAVRRDPANAIALTDAARAFGARFEFGRAERLLNRLTELAGKARRYLAKRRAKLSDDSETHPGDRVPAGGRRGIS